MIYVKVRTIELPWAKTNLESNKHFGVVGTFLLCRYYVATLEDVKLMLKNVGYVMVKICNVVRRRINVFHFSFDISNAR